ncbi:hypothetical protein N9Y81_00290 [Akkermansiaceae bacterium]|jgi:hypothetical protein|nr:hypothetical protein [Akkermansiaceae bacterium]
MVENYMSWEGGVDLLGLFNGSSEPNLIVHVARMVHTPVGSAPAGMILVQSDAGSPPELMGFVSSDPVVGAYFGPKIFAGTPFENAPVLDAQISVSQDGDVLTSTVEVGGKTSVCKLSSLAALESITREPGGMTPFEQQVLEAAAGSAEVSIDGEAIDVTVAGTGLSGGAGAVSSPAGIYS